LEGTWPGAGANKTAASTSAVAQFAAENRIFMRNLLYGDLSGKFQDRVLIVS
jgi:hypothetical protein